MTLRLIVRLSGGEEIGSGEEIPCKTDHRITVILYSDNSDSTVFLHYIQRKMMAQRISSLTSDQLIMSAAAPPPPPPLLEPTTNMTSPNHKKEEDETKANNEEAVVVVVEKPIMARRSARQCNVRV